MATLRTSTTFPIHTPPPWNANIRIDMFKMHSKRILTDFKATPKLGCRPSPSAKTSTNCQISFDIKASSLR